MPNDFNALLRGAYGSSRSKSARRLTVRDPADLDPEDVRYAALRAGASADEADGQARVHASRYGGDGAFDQMLRNDHRAAVQRRPKL